jgi:isopentenyldiphosphate isomerase
MIDELIDAVNDRDEVIGVYPRSEIYAQQLRHRIAHVFLLDASGNIGLARRSKEVKFCPDHWCSTAAGHVSAGETYVDAALREMQEEIGVTVPLTACGVLRFHKQETKHHKFLGAFKAAYAGAFICDPHEVQFVRYFSREQIREMIGAGEPFHPETVALLHYYFL